MQFLNFWGCRHCGGGLFDEWMASWLYSRGWRTDCTAREDDGDGGLREELVGAGWVVVVVAEQGGRRGGEKTTKLIDYLHRKLVRRETPSPGLQNEIAQKLICLFTSSSPPPSPTSKWNRGKSIVYPPPPEDGNNFNDMETEVFEKWGRWLG